MDHKNSSGVTVRTESFSVGSGMDTSGNQTRPMGTVSGNSGTVLGYYPDGKLETTSNGGTLLSCYGGNGRLCLLDTRKFVYDGGQQILERASGGNTRRETVAGLAGDLVADITDGGTITQKSVMYDPSGTLAVSVDGSGTIVRGGADVFGTNPSNSDEANYKAKGGLRNRTTPGIYQSENGGAYDSRLGRQLGRGSGGSCSSDPGNYANKNKGGQGRSKKKPRGPTRPSPKDIGILGQITRAVGKYGCIACLIGTAIPALAENDCGPFRPQDPAWRSCMDNLLRLAVEECEKDRKCKILKTLCNIPCLGFYDY